MPDPLSKAQRSAMMSRIRSRDTKPERVVRSCVHGLGYRFRLHNKKLPGSPDVVLKRLRTVIFVHGCFWHRHQGCKDCSTPKTRVDFWQAKFDANRARDAQAISALTRDNWCVVVIWECETEAPLRLAAKLRRLLVAAERRTVSKRE